MAEAFVARIAKGYKKTIKPLSGEAKETLMNHDWPGNVRELKNLMERAVIFARGPKITTKDLGVLATRNSLDNSSGGSADFPEFPSLKDAREWFDGVYIQRELKLQGGNVTRAAERLGLDRSNLYKRLRTLGIE